MLSTLYQRGDKSKIAEVKSNLSKEVEELDVFFNEYLELFDEQMNSTVESQTAPVWKAYHDMYKRHTQLKADLKLANYYLGKF